MGEFIYQTLTVTGGLSGVAALVVTWVVLKVINQEKMRRAEEAEERKSLRQKMEKLETERLAALEQKINKHLDEDKPGETALQFKQLSKVLDKLDGKLDTVNEAVITLKTESKENRDFTVRLYRSMQKLREEVYRGRRTSLSGSPGDSEGDEEL